MKVALIILLLLCALLAGAVMYLLANRPEVIEISDNLPKTDKTKDYWLKLQNEGKKYVKVKDGKIYLKIVK